MSGQHTRGAAGQRVAAPHGPKISVATAAALHAIDATTKTWKSALPTKRTGAAASVVTPAAALARARLCCCAVRRRARTWMRSSCTSEYTMNTLLVHRTVMFTAASDSASRSPLPLLVLLLLESLILHKNNVGGKKNGDEFGVSEQKRKRDEKEIAQMAALAAHLLFSLFSVHKQKQEKNNKQLHRHQKFSTTTH